MKNKIVDVKNLTKKYEKKDSFALDHINLKIEQGSIFGLLDFLMVQVKVHS